MKPANTTDHAPHSSQRGFTLVELLVALMLTALAVGAMAVFNEYQLRALRDQADQVDLQGTARVIADLFAREVRQAGIRRTSSETGHCGIVQASSNRIRFVFLDTDPNPTDPTAGPVRRELEYQFGSRSISRRDINAGDAEPLVENVDLTGTQLRYFNAAGSPVTDPSTREGRNQMTRIEIQLSMSDGEQQARLTSNIDLRNRFFITDLRTPAPTSTSGLPGCT